MGVQGCPEYLDLGPILEHMSANAKKILITTESREVIVIRRNDGGFPGYCSACDLDVEWLSFDAAVSESALGWRELVARSEKGDLHTFQASSGHLLFCGPSLSALARAEEMAVRGLP